MYLSLLASLPELSAFIYTVYKAFKNDNRISLSESEDICKDLVPLVISLGVPGLNEAKFLRYAPKIIVLAIEIIKQDVFEYKKIRDKEEVHQMNITSQQVYNIAKTYKYEEFLGNS